MGASLEAELRRDLLHGVDRGAVEVDLAGLAQPAVAHRDGEAFEQRLEGRRPARAVGRDPDVALELPHRELGLPAEPAVDPADLEAEVEQPLLERDHVVAGEHRAGRVGQQPVTEPPPRLLERAVGVGTDDAVDGEATLLLERPHGAVEAVVEVVRVGGVVVEEPEHRQPGADLLDGRACVATTVERGGVGLGHAAS